MGVVVSDKEMIHGRGTIAKLQASFLMFLLHGVSIFFFVVTWQYSAVDRALSVDLPKFYDRFEASLHGFFFYLGHSLIVLVKQC